MVFLMACSPNSDQLRILTSQRLSFVDKLTRHEGLLLDHRQMVPDHLIEEEVQVVVDGDDCDVMGDDGGCEDDDEGESVPFPEDEG